MSRYTIPALLVLLAFLFLGCSFTGEECNSRCIGGVLHTYCDYDYMKGACVCHEQTPCPSGQCDTFGQFCVPPSPTPVSCESSYPTCNGICGNGTCRKPEMSSYCACCGDGVVDQIARESCESNSDCPFISVDQNAYECINCECVEITPTPAPFCGDGEVNGFEECEMSTDCSAGTYCFQCQCIVDEMFPTPPPEPTLPPAVTPTPTTTPAPTTTPDPRLCGNGVVNGVEQCDIGGGVVSGDYVGAKPDSCPTGTHCQGCACVPGQPTPRCGDCYISDPAHGGNEQCDVGNNPVACQHSLPDTCPLPSHCFSCQCVGGTPTPEPTETMVTPTPSPAMTPTPVPTPTPYLSYCGDGVCDANEKSTVREVSTGYTCTLTNCPDDCIYPTDQKDCSRDCSAYATSIGYTDVLGSHITHPACDTAFTTWYDNQQRQCYTVCGYNSYTNIGGCCVAKKLEVACTDCPGEHPVCPQTCGG